MRPVKKIRFINWHCLKERKRVDSIVSDRANHERFNLFNEMRLFMDRNARKQKHQVERNRANDSSKSKTTESIEMVSFIDQNCSWERYRLEQICFIGQSHFEVQESTVKSIFIVGKPSEENNQGWWLSFDSQKSLFEERIYQVWSVPSKKCVPKRKSSGVRVCLIKNSVQWESIWRWPLWSIENFPSREIASDESKMMIGSNSGTENNQSDRFARFRTLWLGTDSRLSRFRKGKSLWRWKIDWGGASDHSLMFGKRKEA